MVAKVTLLLVACVGAALGLGDSVLKCTEVIHGMDKIGDRASKAVVLPGSLNSGEFYVHSIDRCKTSGVTVRACGADAPRVFVRGHSAAYVERVGRHRDDLAVKITTYCFGILNTTTTTPHV